jgi:hypothetical protein
MTSSRIGPDRVGRALPAALLACALLAQGCASPGSAQPLEYLDERTAATITVAAESLVFALARPELGVNARDYVTLTAVDVNTSGRHARHLVGYAWSTLDKRALQEDAGSYELVADDRVLPLARMPGGFASIGVAEPPLEPPARAAMPLSAPVTAEQLQFVLDASTRRVVRTRDGVAERFELWNTAGR